MTLDRVLGDLLEAAGVLTPDGQLDAGWFADPLGHLREALASTPRRAALEDALAAVDPPLEVGQERWHPLADGLFLTLLPGSPSVWGAAARYSTDDLAFSANIALFTTGDDGIALLVPHDITLSLRVLVPDGRIGPIALTAVRLELGTAGFALTAEALDSGDGPRDVTFQHLGTETSRAVLDLLRAALDGETGPLSHLPGALGLADLPPLPVEQWTDPTALRAWIRAVAADPTWLSQVSGLLGGIVAPTGSGTLADPFSVPLSSSLALTVVRGDDVQLGASLRLGADTGRLRANVVLAEIPATLPFRAFPRATALLELPGDGGWLAGDDTSAFAIRTLRAGIQLGDGVEPMLELDTVRVDGHEHPRLDLSSASAIADAASTLVRDALLSALGDDPAALHLLALVGLGAPDPSWPHTLDIGAFAADPLAAILAYHRRVLADPVHTWATLQAELGALLGLPGPVTGTGTEDDPWVLVAAADAVEWVVWSVDDTLSMGLRVAGVGRPFTVAWRATVVAFDLTSPSVRLAGEQSLRVRVDAPPSDIVSADALELVLTGSPGNGIGGRLVVDGLTVDGVPVGTLQLPVDLDPDDPAGSLGLDPAALEQVLLTLLSSASTAWGGNPGAVVSQILADGLEGIVDDPVRALGEQLARLVLTVDDDGPVLLRTLALLGTPIGRGTAQDPWLLQLPLSDGTLAVWLTPDGPPGTWAEPLRARITTAFGWRALADAGLALAPYEATGLDGVDLDVLATGWTRLSLDLASGDGLVPYTSAAPAQPGWDHGRVLRTPHLDAPRDPAAVSQILDRAGAGGLVLLSPSFADPAVWDPLLAEAVVRGRTVDTAARCDLATSGLDPLQVPLDPLDRTSDVVVVRLGATQRPEQVAAVVARFRSTRADTPVVLVGHSTAGLAARAFTEATPTAVSSLVTVATPHAGTPLAPLRDAEIADAVRVTDTLGLPGTLGDALRVLVQGLDGWEPDGVLPPAPSTMPWATFLASSGAETGSVPALALGSALGDPLITAVRTALLAKVDAAVARTDPAPTHLVVGVRSPVTLAAPGPGEIGVALAVTTGIVRGALDGSGFTPDDTASATIGLSRPGGWLVGSAGARPDPATAAAEERVRSAELRLDYTIQSGPVAGVRLHDAGRRGVRAPTVATDDPLVEPLLAAIAGNLSTGGSAATTVLVALEQLGITAGAAFASDALVSLRWIPGTFLTPRLVAALADGWLGYSPSGLRADGGPTITVRPDGTFGIAHPVDDLHVQVGGTWSPSGSSAELRFGIGVVGVRWAVSRITLEPAPYAEPLVLWPVPDRDALRTWVLRQIPRVLLSGAASLALDGMLGDLVQLGPIHPLVESPGDSALRGLGDGERIDVARVRTLVAQISAVLDGDPDHIDLPGDLRLSVPEGDVLRFRLETRSPLGGVLDVAVNVDVAADLAVSVGGRVALHVALGDAPWASLDVVVEDGALRVIPADLPPIELWPRFGGFGSLAEGLGSLLGRVLDALVEASDPSDLRAAALDLASALALYDAAGGFAAHDAALRDLASPGGLGRVAAGARGPAVAAAGTIVGLLPIPGTLAVDGGVLRWSDGPLAVGVGWDEAGPLVFVEAEDLVLGPAIVDLAVSPSSADVSIAVDLRGFGVDALPELSLTGGVLTLRPINGLHIVLAPTPSVEVGPDVPAAIAAAAAGLAGVVALRIAGTRLDTPVVTGGPTIRALLVDAGLAIDGPLRPAAPLPSPSDVLSGLLAAVDGTVLSIEDLAITLHPDAASVRGQAAVDIGAYRVTAWLGTGEGLPSEPFGGLHVGLDGTFEAIGVGAELSRAGGTPLVSAAGFALGRIGAVVYVDADEPFGAGLVLGDVAVPLGLASGASGNPVASDLMSGEQDEGAAPTVDVAVIHRNDDTTVLIGGGTQPVVVDIERSFGPLHLRRLAVQPLDGAVALSLDGGLDLGVLAAEVLGLTVTMDLDDIVSPSEWALDLQGLALTVDTAGVVASGGLWKVPGPSLEYAGVLVAEVAGRSFSAIGSWARLVDAQGSATSLMVFAVVPITGGPAEFRVEAVAAGLGYNRDLLLPAAVDDVPDHPLLLAMDSGGLADDPMGALVSMRAQLPARRGRFWAAAGIRFTTYGLIKSRALLYLVVDRQIEIGLLGTSRLLLPNDDDALVSIELALVARYSQAEQVLSIQAQLTDRSWLFSRDCRLTGGFAWVVWFARGEFVLTLGGYHPSFPRPAHYPVVPPLGFDWQASQHVVLNGTAFFALTTSCVMAGGELSIDYRKGGAHAWFIASAKLLVAWDPFAYDFEFGIDIGASYTFEVCFIWCKTLTLGFSLGGDVRLRGPPLHAEVSIDLGVTSFTVSFGPDPSPRSYLPTFGVFVDRYLRNADGEALDVRIAGGIAPSDRSLPAGTASDPWRTGTELTLGIESRMPATHLGFQSVPATPAAADDLDIAPMGDVAVDRSELRVLLERRTSTGWSEVATGPALTLVPVPGTVPEATWRHVTGDQEAAANTLAALVGARLVAEAFGLHPSAVIPIGALATDEPAWARPLPLARGDRATWQSFGEAADVMALVGTSADAEQILAGSGVFAEQRAAVGASAAGLGTVATRSLRRRSSPPVVAPLSTGMTMRDVGRPAAPPSPVAVEAAPIALGSPRLRLVARPETVAVSATVQTRAATAGLGVRRNPGRVHAVRIAEWEKALGDRVEVPSGAVQVWEVPSGGRWEIEGVARIVALDRRDRVLLDSVVTQGIELPSATARVAVWSLGVEPAPWPAGWTAGSPSVRIAGRVLLVPGALVVAARSVATGDVARQIANLPGAETWLPAGTKVVALALEVVDCTAADDGDLAVSIRGGTAKIPVRVGDGRRRLVLYDVTDSKDRVIVGVASHRGFVLAGVAGLDGDAASWADKLGKTLELAVPTSLGTATGALRMHFEPQGGRRG